MKSQLKWGVILSYITTALNMIIQLLYTPLMIRILGQSEYGLYTLVASMVSYLSLFSLGFSGAYLFFYSRYKKKQDRNAVGRLNGLFILVFLCMAIIALTVGLLLSQNTTELFGNKLTVNELNKAKILMQILVINISLTFPASVFDSIVSAHEQYIFQRLLVLAGIIFNPFICLPLLLMGFDSIVLVSVTTIITICKLLLNSWFCICKLNVEFVFKNLDFKLLKEIAGFSFFLFLNMFIDQINWMVDKIILGRVAGTIAVAVYGVGSQINALYIQFSSAISAVFCPRINRIAAENKSNMKLEFTELFIKVGRIQFIVLMSILSGFIFFGEYFITNIYVTTEYEEAYEVALLLIAPVTVPLIQNIGIEIQRSINKHQVRAIIYTLMALANIAISIPLAKAYGPIGSALGTAIGLSLANGLIMNVYYQKAVGINIIEFWKNILSLSKGLIIPSVLGLFIWKNVRFTGVISFVVWATLYIVFYALSMWLFGMNTFEKGLILQPLKRIYGKCK